MDRATKRLLVVGGLLTTLLGVAGLLLASECALLVLPSPKSAKHRAWRLLALTTLTSGLIAALIGGAYFGVADVSNGTQTTSQSVFAFFEGGVILGVPGTVLGALIGSILAVDYWRRARDPESLSTS